MQTQLRQHIVMSTVSTPCSLKRGYSDLLANSFCKKPQVERSFGNSYFVRSRVNEMI